MRFCCSNRVVFPPCKCVSRTTDQTALVLPRIGIHIALQLAEPLFPLPRLSGLERPAPCPTTTLAREGQNVYLPRIPIDDFPVGAVWEVLDSRHRGGVSVAGRGHLIPSRSTATGHNKRGRKKKRQYPDRIDICGATCRQKDKCLCASVTNRYMSKVYHASVCIDSANTP